MLQHATPFVNGKLLVPGAKDKFAERLAKSLNRKYKDEISLLEVASPGGSLLPRLLPKLKAKHIIVYAHTSTYDGTSALKTRLNTLSLNDKNLNVLPIFASLSRIPSFISQIEEGEPEVIIHSFSLHEFAHDEAKDNLSKLLTNLSIKQIYIIDAYTPFENNYIHFFKMLYRLIHLWAGVEVSGGLWAKSHINSLLTNDLSLRMEDTFESFIDVPFETLHEVFRNPACSLMTLKVMLEELPFPSRDNILRLPVIYTQATR